MKKDMIMRSTRIAFVLVSGLGLCICANLTRPSNAQRPEPWAAAPLAALLDHSAATLDWARC